MTWRERRRRRAELDQQLEEHLAYLRTATRHLEDETAQVHRRLEEMDERTHPLTADT